LVLHDPERDQHHPVARVGWTLSTPRDHFGPSREEKIISIRYEVEASPV